MQIDSLHSQIDQDLRLNLRPLLPNHSFEESFNYCLFPVGKLIRPKMVWSVAYDRLEKDKLTPELKRDFCLFACAIEYFHNYTLIHDDLPCMDDDDVRRGRPSLHKAFPEWQALLTGDALMMLSFEVLSELNSPQKDKIIKLFCRLTGPRGLLLGQVLDMRQTKESQFQWVLETHKLKTARLFQTALLGSLYISEIPSFSIFKAYYSLAHHFGIAFQLLDDLSELCDLSPIEKHELQANPFLFCQEKAFNQLEYSLKIMRRNILKNRLLHFQQISNKLISHRAKQVMENQNRLKDSKVNLPAGFCFENFVKF